MGDPEAREGVTFATLLKQTRRLRGMTQDDLIEASGVSRSTVLRWEKGTPGTIDVEQVRKLCAALKLDAREAVVALGFVTREELGLPPAPPPMDPVLWAAAKMLANEDIPAAARGSLRQLIGHAVDFTYQSLGLRKPTPPPKEPSAVERAGGKPVRP